MIIKKWNQFKLDEKKTDKEEEYGCIMMYFKLPNWYEYLIEIDKKDIYDTDKYEFGLEIEPHTTLMYGVHDTVDPKDVVKYLEKIKKFKGKLTEVSVFEIDEKEYDVVKFDVDSDKLFELRKEVEKKFENTQSFPDYHPHATIAYVKKGKGKKYAKKLKDVSIDFKLGVYSDKNHDKSFVNLK